MTTNRENLPLPSTSHEATSDIEQRHGVRKDVIYYEHSLQMQQSGDNIASPEIVNTLNSLASAWSDLYDHKKAISYYLQSLEMQLSIHGTNTAHPGIAGTLCNLGDQYNDLGDHRKAVSYHEQSLKMFRCLYGDETAHPDIARALNNMGVALGNMGDHGQAIAYFEQSLQMKRSIYSEDNHDISSSLSNIASACNDLGDHGRAVSYFKQSLQVEQSIHGENTLQPCIASTLNSIGNTLSDLGDYQNAVRYYEQSLQMRQRIYGESTAHPDTASSLNNLGAAWGDLGDHRKAIGCYEQSLKMKRDIYGNDTFHPDIAVSLNNLGNAWSDLGDHRKAVSCYEQALQMRQSINGKDIRMEASTSKGSSSGLPPKMVSGKKRKRLERQETEDRAGPSGVRTDSRKIGQRTRILQAFNRLSLKVTQAQLKPIARSLGLNKEEIDVIKASSPDDLPDQVYQTLVKWREKEGEAATLPELEKHLRYLEFHLLADHLSPTPGEGDISPSNKRTRGSRSRVHQTHSMVPIKRRRDDGAGPSGIGTGAVAIGVEKYFDKVIAKVSSKWDHLAKKLGFDLNEIKGIQSSEPDHDRRCREVLYRWMNRKGMEATLQVLKQALEDIGEKLTAQNL